jgi:hypothetical protein
MAKFTVIGLIDRAGALQVAGVVPGSHPPVDLTVQSGGLQRWARTLTAPGWREAEDLARAEVESQSLLDGSPGCSCGQADYGAPGHDGDPENLLQRAMEAPGDD